MRHVFNTKRYWARGTFPKFDHHVRVHQIKRCLCGDALRPPHPFCRACTDRLPAELQEGMLNAGSIDGTLAGVATAEQWLRMNPKQGALA